MGSKECTRSWIYLRIYIHHAALHGSICSVFNNNRLDLRHYRNWSESSSSYSNIGNRIHTLMKCATSVRNVHMARVCKAGWIYYNNHVISSHLHDYNVFFISRSTSIIRFEHTRRCTYVHPGQAYNPQALEYRLGLCTKFRSDVQLTLDWGVIYCTTPRLGVPYKVGI